MDLERLYLDYNATSPLSASVLNWLRSGDVIFANPASQHSDGKSSRKSVNESRALIYKTFHQAEKSSKLFFHSGATEGIVTFTHSFSEVARKAGKPLLVCYSKVDHPAVVSLKDRFWGEHVEFFELKRNQDLRYLHQENLTELRKLKSSRPELLILYHHLWVHNETGQVSPLSELVAFKEIPDLYLHIDAVQSPGKIPDWQNLSHGDIWTFSAHKFGALKGIGFSFFKSELPFEPLILGGGQQASLRSGTENTQGIKSIALALSDLVQVNVDENSLHRQRLLTFLKQELAGIGEVIDEGLMCSNTIYFYLNDLSSDIALALFDIHGIEISAGSACSSGAAKESEVLLQKGLKRVAKNGLRLSMGFKIIEEDLNKVQDRLRPIFNKLRNF